MTWDQVQGIIRAVLVAVGTVLSTFGWMSGTTWEMVTGGVLAVAQVVWSIWHNGQQGPVKA